MPSAVARIIQEQVTVSPSQVIPPLSAEPSAQPAAQQVIEIPLTPTVQKDYSASTLFPQSRKLAGALPFVPSDERCILVNVETTGVFPWDSRITCIGFIDLTFPSPEVKQLMLEDEEAMIIQFLEYVRQGKFSTMIAYNIAFDFRFLMSRAFLYKLAAKEFADINLFDLQQVFEQVKTSFVYGQNKAGTMEQWSAMLLNKSKTVTEAEQLKAYADGNWQLVADFNANNVWLAYDLYNIVQFCLGVPIGQKMPSTEMSFTEALPSQNTLPETQEFGNPLPLVPEIPPEWAGVCSQCGAGFKLGEVACSICGKELNA